MLIELDLTEEERDALLEAVEFDAGLDESAGGNPYSPALLEKIKEAIRNA